MDDRREATSTMACWDLREDEEQARKILLTKEGIRENRRGREHRTLRDITKISWEVRQVKLAATVTKEGGMGGGHLSLMGKDLGKSSHKLVEKSKIGGSKILQADEAQQP